MVHACIVFAYFLLKLLDSACQFFSEFHVLPNEKLQFSITSGVLRSYHLPVTSSFFKIYFCSFVVFSTETMMMIIYFIRSHYIRYCYSDELYRKNSQKRPPVLETHRWTAVDFQPGLPKALTSYVFLNCKMSILFVKIWLKSL